MGLKNSARTAIPNSILERIFEAAGDEETWGTALSEIAQWVGASGAMYCLIGNDSGMAPRVKAIYSSGFAADSNAAYAEKGYLADPHMPLGMETPLNTWFFSQDHFDSDFIARDAFFQDVMNPLGIRWVAGSRLWDADKSVACLALQKPSDARHFADLDRARLAALTPHLSRATRIHHRLASHAFDATIGIEAMNNLRFGVALLDADVRVMFSNGVADRLFRCDAVFKALPRDCIGLVHSGSQAEFARAVTNAVVLGSTTLCVLDRHGRPAINASVVPLPAAARANLNWQRPLAMLTMSEIRPSRGLSNDLLRQLFALTPAECNLANGLLIGQSLNEYAELRRVSIETARTQMKAVLSKTGMRRQAELLAYLARLQAI